MAATTTIEAPRIFPTLRCKDAEAMIRWLTQAFGFREHVVYRGDGVVRHAELAFGSSLPMLGQHRDDDYGKLVGAPEGRRGENRNAAARHRLWSRDCSCCNPEGNLWSFGAYLAEGP